MPWSPSPTEVRKAAQDSLAYVSGVYRVRLDGDLAYDGVRPGPGWTAHGWFPRRIKVLRGGTLRRRRLWKRRWLAPDEHGTQHSRPPDELGGLSFCTLGVILVLWAVLDGDDGPEVCRQVHEAMEDQVSPRTTRRWLARAVRAAERLQHDLREAVIRKSEPRPVELFFPGGLDPPEGLRRRRWRDPYAVVATWRGIAFLLGGAVRLGVATSLLLAEARGRSSTPTSTWF